MIQVARKAESKITKLLFSFLFIYGLFQNVSILPLVLLYFIIIINSFKVWYNAITQMFFSLAICFGTLVMYASFNNFRKNIYR